MYCDVDLLQKVMQTTRGISGWSFAEQIWNLKQKSDASGEIWTQLSVAEAFISVSDYKMF